MQTGTLQVTLTGARLWSQDEAKLHQRLGARFKLAPAQVAAMLQGRITVKRGLDDATAQALVKVLTNLGLEAVAEPIAPLAPGPVPVPKPAVAKPAVVAPAPAPAPARTATVPKVRNGVRYAPALDALIALGTQRLPRPGVSANYVLGLALVTLLCVALPAIYVGLTAGLAYGWWWYLTHLHEFMPRMRYLTLLMYLIPGIAGLLLLAFLVRPLFLGRRKRYQGMKLDPREEPGFVAGVHALCRALGVAPPREIWVSYEVNASIHFRSGWASLFTGHKVLTVGAPLVAAFTARQFVGVLAHEFGHCAQRVGMVCWYVINGINGWFEYRAYGYDSWEEKLKAWIDDEVSKDSAIGNTLHTPALVAWGAIQATRKLFGGLFHLSLRVSGHAARQGEIDADRYEALLAGSDAFRGTSRRIWALQQAWREVNQANIDAWRDQRLLRDLPDAAAAHVSGFDAKRLAAVDAEMGEDTITRYWDSHPPTTERIEHVEQRPAPGIYLSDAPAATLFNDFASWSRRATQLFYQHEGVPFTDEHLCDREEVLGRMQTRITKVSHVESYFNGQFCYWPMLVFEVPAAPVLEWQKCIDELRRRSPDIARLWKLAGEADGRRGHLRVAVRLGYTSTQMRIPGPTRESAALVAELENIAARRMDYDKPLAEALALYARRMAYGIDALTGPDRTRAEALRQQLEAMAGLVDLLADADEYGSAVEIYHQIAEGEESLPEGYEEMSVSFVAATRQIIRQAEAIPQAVASGGTVGGYVRSRCPRITADPDAMSADDFLRAAWNAPGAFRELYLLAVGELVALCESAERAQGIRPIKVL
jgi:Zn-dependent protease with chaperone function